VESLLQCQQNCLKLQNCQYWVWGHPFGDNGKRCSYWNSSAIGAIARNSTDIAGSKNCSGKMNKNIFYITGFFWYLSQTVKYQKTVFLGAIQIITYTLMVGVRESVTQTLLLFETLFSIGLEMKRFVW